MIDKIYDSKYVLRTLEKLLIKRENTKFMDICIDTIVIVNRYNKTLGDFNKVEDWKNKEKKFYMKRYNLTDEEFRKNFDHVRKMQKNYLRKS